MPLDAWENVADGLERVAVPGGWLYRCFRYDSAVNDYVVSALCFVPAPAKGHEGKEA